MAEVILDLPEDEQVIIFRVLPAALAADVFEYIGVEEQQKLLRAMAHEQVVAILNEMSPDDRTALLEELPSAAARQLIRLLTPEERHVATALLGYPEDSVGRLMTPDFIAVKEDWTVQHVLDYVRQYGRDSETLNFVYVVDDRGKLIDDVRMREFLLRPLTTKVSEIRDETFVALNVTDSQAGRTQHFPQIRPRRAAGRRFKRRARRDRDERRHARRRGRGGDRGHPETRRYGGARRAVHDHPVSADGKETCHLADHSVSRRNAHRHRDAGLQRRDRKSGDSGDVFAVDHFQRRQLRVAGDHAGDPRDGSRRIASARLVSRRPQRITLGTFARLDSGTIGFFRITLWQYLHIFDYGEYHWLVALTVGVALVGVVLWGTLSGAMLPFLLRRCGLDPAASSAPFVATLVDVTGLVIYFNVALFILRGTLL